jgi:MoaA/NifB/PqqE/SkfB family radical SAM enzyme
MCGDVGDPIYCRELIEICAYIKNINPDIHVFIVTNGSHRATEWWQRLATVLNHRDTINFSIDGYDNRSNNLYRVGSAWQSIMSGIRTVRECNDQVFLNWAAIVFRFNQDHLDVIANQAKQLGMDGLQITKSTKFGTVYQGYGHDDPLEPRAEFVSSSHRYERRTINLSGRICDNHDYLSVNHMRFKEASVRYQNQPVIPLCEIGNRGLYVNAEGVVFPCSWVSFPYDVLTHNGRSIQWQESFFANHRDRLNLHHRSIEDILNDPVWHKCSQGFRNADKTWVECAMKCSQQLVDENYAVGWETN